MEHVTRSAQCYGAADVDEYRAFGSKEIDNIPDKYRGESTWKSSVIRVSVLVVSVLLIAFASSQNELPWNHSGTALGEINGDSRIEHSVIPASLELAVSSLAYGVVNTDSYPWSHVAEPWRDTSYKITNGAANSNFTWSAKAAKATARDIEAIGQAPLDACTSSICAGLTCVSAGTVYQLSVIETASTPTGHDRLRQSTFNVHCKYVRRELRELQANDLRTYWDAVEKVHRLSLREGLEKYGQKFRNYETLTIKHLDRRTLLGCTPYHGADVFLTAHSALNLEFEQALQSIDPSIAAPYWDYTIDDAVYGESWYEDSPIFSSDFYGSTDGINSSSTDHSLRDRWAVLPIANQGALDFDRWPEANGWGRLTESWNTDPTMFVSRSRSICGLETKARLPGCTTLRGALSKNDTSSFRKEIEYSLHAEVHSAIGGAWQCSMPGGDSLNIGDMLASLPSNATQALENVALNLNLFWRGMFNSSLNSHYPILCPENLKCAEGGYNTSWSARECRCSNPAFDMMMANASTLDEEYDVSYNALDDSMFFILAAYKSQGTRISDFLAQGVDGKWMWLDSNGAFLDDDTNKAMTAFIGKLIFHPGFIGPFTGPLAGTNDPLFWTVHSNFEHLWHYKRASAQQNSSRVTWSDTWDVYTTDDDWYQMMGCWGYLYDAKLPWSNLFGESASIENDANVVYSDIREELMIQMLDMNEVRGQSGYTNRELSDLFDPWNSNSLFQYSSFSWSHCEAE